MADPGSWLAEHLPLPDAMLRRAIACKVAHTHRLMRAAPATATATFASLMKDNPIARYTEAANEQHYELPAAFFAYILGPHRKYSSGYYASPDDTLEQAEAQALSLTCAHANLCDGQTILELGCGWGSLSLWLACHYPAAHITAISNSHSQRSYILAEAAARGLTNLQVITADMNRFDTPQRFDRILSVEMFEHMANWPALLAKCRRWLHDDGRLFLHVFSHIATPYSFVTEAQQGGRRDWIAQHFFTGGIMPSHRLVHEFADILAVEEEWWWDGRHYQRTALDWLKNHDAHRHEIALLLRDVYGPQAALWQRRWRLFFLAVAGLFGHAAGQTWGVSHYRLTPAKN